MEFLLLRCAQCGWEADCGPRDLRDHLLRARLIGPRSESDWGTLRELAIAASDKLACPECGTQRISVSDDSRTDWPEDRPCAACGKLIPGERIAVLPHTEYCAECQTRMDRGELPVATEFCPQCGSPMRIRTSRGPGITRQELVCSASPPCRSRRRW